MTFGAWMVFAAVVVFGLAAVVATDATAALVGRAWKGFSSRRAGLLKALSGLGLVLGACVAMYTGVLLMSAPGVPLWNTFLLPCLFTVSAFDTGIALVEIVLAVQAKRERLSRKAHTLMNVLVVVLVDGRACRVDSAFCSPCQVATERPKEAAVAAAAMQSAALVVSGQLAPFFWVLVVACGLLLPLLMAIAGLMAKPRARMWLLTRKRRPTPWLWKVSRPTLCLPKRPARLPLSVPRGLSWEVAPCGFW